MIHTIQTVTSFVGVPARFDRDVATAIRKWQDDGYNVGVKFGVSDNKVGELIAFITVHVRPQRRERVSETSR
jgi:hypothetical protein